MWKIAFGLKFSASFTNTSELWILLADLSTAKKTPTNEILGELLILLLLLSVEHWWMVWNKNAIVSWNGCHWHEWCDARIFIYYGLVLRMCLSVCLSLCVLYGNCKNCFILFWKWKARDLNSFKFKVSLPLLLQLLPSASVDEWVCVHEHTHTHIAIAAYKIHIINTDEIKAIKCLMNEMRLTQCAWRQYNFK